MALDIKENILLSGYSRMRVGGPAKYLAHVKSRDELKEAVEFAKEKKLRILPIGRGANILFTDAGYDGLVLFIDIMGFEVLESGEEALIKVGAGEIWDDVVKKTVEMGFSGMEAMSMIPGRVGASPVMNIGAYGQDVSSIIVNVDAFDLKKNEFVSLSSGDCKFDYRGSIFSNEDKGRFVITDITFKLHHNLMEPPFYKDIEKYFEENGIKEYTPDAVRKAVVYIRTNKLPDPSKIGTNGSFFKNPIVGMDKWNELVEKFPELDSAEPQWPQKPRWFQDDGTVKIAGARLIELAGMDKYRNGDVYIWPKQHLTIVNEGAKSAKEVLDFKDKVKEAVKEKFGIELEEEVQII